MAASELSLEEILNFFVEKGGIVANRDVVRHFKRYLTDPSTQDDARAKFKKFVNQLATTKTEGNEKFLILRPKYNQNEELQSASPLPPVLHQDYRNAAISLPPSSSPSLSFSDFSPVNSPVLRQPPPYRPPPPVTPTSSSDNISISSSNYSLHSSSDLDNNPYAPPRKKLSEKKLEAELKALENDNGDFGNGDITEIEHEAKEVEKQSISVKERLQKFNKMASADDELSLSPRQKDKKKLTEKGVDEDDGASVISLDPKRCAEWYVTAAKGDYQDLAKLASNEPRFVKLKDPYTNWNGIDTATTGRYNVLHWGAKHGNMDIIKLFAGKYRCDVNAKTNGGYTPLHLGTQFGHEKLCELLIDVYGANPNVRDHSGRLPSHYKASQIQADAIVTKKKGRKKTADKDLGFLRIGSLNVRVKKTTEAFSNFLGVGNAAGIISPVDNFHKGWGSADNVAQAKIIVLSQHSPNSWSSQSLMNVYEFELLCHPADVYASHQTGACRVPLAGPAVTDAEMTRLSYPSYYEGGIKAKRKIKRPLETSGANSTPGTPNNYPRALSQRHFVQDSDSDSAAGFDSQWQN